MSKVQSAINIILVISLMLFGVVCQVEVSDVKAAGTSEVKFYVIDDGRDGYGNSSETGAWTNDAHDNSVTWVDNTGVMVVGYQQAVSGTAWVIQQSILGIDISSYDDSIVPQDIYLNLYCTAENHDTGEPIYFALYQGTPGLDATVDSDDWDSAIDDFGAQRISLIVDKADTSTSTWVEFHIQTDWYDYATTPDANGYVWFYLASTYHMLDYAPNVGSDGFTNLSFQDKGGGANDPELVIEYIEDVTDRDIVHHVNGDDYAGALTGNEACDNLTWQSSRCGWSDKGLEVLAHGDPGANVTIQLVNVSGSVLDEISDDIKVDGLLGWYTDLPDNFDGFVRFQETQHNVFSEWGYQAAKPSSTMQANTVYARYTEHPQYNKPFNDYVVDENEVMRIIWQTNVQAAETDNYSLRLWANGDNVTGEKLNITLSDLADTYYKCSDNNTFQAAYCYMFISPNITSSGFNDYDGLIYDLSMSYTASNTGFVQAVIFGDVENEILADAHSCYWYLSSPSQGIIMDTNKSRYSAGDDVQALVTIGGDCQVELNQNYLECDIIYLDDSTYTFSTGNVTIREGLNTVTLQAPAYAEDYEVRFVFSAEDITWQYIHDVEISVYTGGVIDVGEIGESIGDRINNLLAQWGMDNDSGHIIWILIVMVLLFLIAYKHEMLRVVFPMVALAVGIAIGWVDIWLIILLAAGVGFSVYKFLKGRKGEG